MSANSRRTRGLQGPRPRNAAVRAECQTNPRFNQLLAMATANGLPAELQSAYLQAYWDCRDLQLGIATTMLPGYNWGEYLAELAGDLANKYIDENPRAALLVGSTAQCRQRILTICNKLGWTVSQTEDRIEILDELGLPVTVSVPFNSRNLDTALRVTLESIELLI